MFTASMLASVILAQGSEAAAPPLMAWEWFPAQEPTLAPYLSNLNMYGTNCLNPGALIESDPMSQAAQWVKTELAKAGINYRLDQSYTFAAMSDVTRGNNVLNFYSMQLIGNWVLFNSTDLGGTSGWIAFEANAGAGLGFDLRDQSPHQNTGSVTWPNYGWLTSSAYISQLQWSQSFLSGSLIVQAGMIDPTLYIDANSYANNQYSQLMNWAFVNSQVLPFSFGSLGAVIQWQPCHWFYLMFATGANNLPSGRPPWYQVGTENWSYIWELGLVSEDTFGLGPGTYRAQPFFGTYRGESGAGIAFNIEQSLGKESNLGYFGRFGVGGENITLVNGAAAQIATGLALVGPNFGGKEKDASDYLALGFVWSQAPNAPAVHQNEYGIEITYSCPITPTLTLQPDLQVIWNPMYGTADTSVVFQFQVVLTW